MGPAHYVKARQYFFQNDPCSEGNCPYSWEEKIAKKVIQDTFQKERLRIVPKLGIQLSLTSGPLDCVQLSLDGASATPGICILFEIGTDGKKNFWPDLYLHCFI